MICYFESVMKCKIEHQGIVKSVSQNIARISIIQVSACSGCHAANYCSVSEKKEKIINIPVTENLNIGDTVWIEGELSMAYKALNIAILYPFLCLIIVLSVSYYISHNELVSGMFSLIVLLLYYGVLYLIKDKLKKQFVFTLKKRS